jgi:hypothetical protein
MKPHLWLRDESRAVPQLLLLVLLPTTAVAGYANCRVLASSWGGSLEAQAKAGYAYKVNETRREYVREEPSKEHSGCELQSFSHAQLNRSFVLGATRPFIIHGATEAWAAHEKWTLQRMAAEHGSDVFLAGMSGEKTVGSVLQQHDQYHVGQMNSPLDCYSAGMDWPDCDTEGVSCHNVLRMVAREYSPFISKVSDDYTVPDYLTPLRVLQMSISNGTGTGVRFEEHPSSWFAAVKGRKRWVFHPPNALEPDDLLLERPSCGLPHRYATTVQCDQDEGTIMWVPAGWWHETCGLDSYFIGLGGTTYDGADEYQGKEAESECITAAPRSEYQTKQVPYCQASEDACPALPMRPVTAHV